MKLYRFSTAIVAPLVVALCALGMNSVVQATPIIEIHGDPTPPFPILADGHHFSWFGLDEDLSTPNITDVSYSFVWSAAVQAFFGGADVSSADQKARVADAFAAWAAATPGLNFFEVAGVGTISAGTALNFNSTGFATALGLGGGLGSVHLAGPDGGVNHHLTDALAIQRGTVAWHNGAGLPPVGMWDYLTVATQEAGHAIGLGHNASDPNSVMNGTLPSGTRRFIVGDDSASINFLYPLGTTSVPEPGSLLLLATGLLGLAARRRQQKAA